MSTLLVLLRKDIANFLRNRAAVVLTFLVPLMLIYVFGWVFGLNKRKDEGPRGFPLAIVNESTHPGAQTLIDALKREPSFRVVTTYRAADKTERPLTAAIAEERIKAGSDYRFALVIPADLLPKNKLGIHLVILSDPRNEIETQMVNGLLQKTIFSNVPQLLGQSLTQRAKEQIGVERFGQMNRGLSAAVTTAFGGDAEKLQRDIDSGNFLGGFTGKSSASGNGTATADTNLLGQVFNLETKQVVGQQVKSPEATRIIGGQAIMFLLFAVSASAAAFFDEKNAGLFQRLLSAPVSRAQLLWSRFVFAVLLGLVQLSTMFVMGQVLYGIDVTGHIPGLLVVATLAAGTCAAFGMLIAAFSPNSQAASGLATFFVMIMSATGGAWFPMSLMPPFMQQIGKCTLVYWSMEGFTQVLWAGKSILQILPILGILAAITAAVMAISVWRINQKKIFG